MDLNTIWFILITVLFIGYFFLEGFDYGVGMLLPFIAKDDTERRMIINTIGPHWDGNEVWLLTAGGASFAAFPEWYATLFSGFYIPLFLMLLGLIVRAVAFEYRSKEDSLKWRYNWDWMIFVGSFLTALLWGVAVANIMRGTPIDATKTYTGGFFNLLNPYGLIGGITFVVLFLYHGAVFLSLKIGGEFEERIKATAEKLWLPAVVLAVIFVAYTYVDVEIFSAKGFSAFIPPLIAAVSLVLSGVYLKSNKIGLSFILVALTVVFVTITAFYTLYPNVMISSTSPEYNLTIYNSSASQYTLGVMTWVAGILVPFVLVYQAWSYIVFKKRLTKDSELEY
jgi:cytochrome d ubiquinol oxidase subunit II